MSRFSHWTLLGLSAVALSACSAPPPPPPAPPPAATEPGTRVDQLRRLVERYWDENSALSGPVPWGPGGNIAPQAVADSLALEKRYLDEVAAIPRTALDDASALT